MPRRSRQNSSSDRVSIGRRSAPLSTREGAFQEGLRKLGYVEGKNITIEYRYAEENSIVFRYGQRAGALKVDLILGRTTPAIKAAKNSTNTIPIIMAAFRTRLAPGLLKALLGRAETSPVLLQSPELSGKRLELLKQVIPKLSRVALSDT